MAKVVDLYEDPETGMTMARLTPEGRVAVGRLMLTDTRARAEREVASWVADLAGEYGEGYREGWVAGFRLGYAEAEHDAHERAEASWRYPDPETKP